MSVAALFPAPSIRKQKVYNGWKNEKYGLRMCVLDELLLTSVQRDSGIFHNMDEPVRYHTIENKPDP